MTEQTKVRIKEWGNSLGVTIPKEIVIKENLKPNDEITITVTKKEVIEDFFGKLKEARINAQKMKDESRKMWKMS